MTGLEKKVAKLIEKSILELGYELYDVIYAKEGQYYYLRVFLDSPKGISLDDCEKVSNIVSEILDKDDFIKEQYFLEVSSTGIEKVLREDKHLEANLDKEVEIKLFKPINKNKIIDGILKKFSDDEIQLETDDETINIDRNNIALIKTVYKW